ncbi:MAG TPA: serine hydrolase, partial [Longimicrobiaceae bacterium]|nr:serine hydrolase [Longimicrobiaceae bacterium]
AKARAGLGVPADSAAAARPGLRAEADVEAAGRAHERALAVLGARTGSLLRGCRRTVLVSPPGVEIPVLAGELARRLPGLPHLAAEEVPRRGPLTPRADFAGNRADCLVLARVPGRRVTVRDPAPDTAAAPADTVPRRVVEVHLPGGPDDVWPGAAAAVLAAGGGPEAQRAAARAVAGEVEPVLALTPALAWPPARRLARAAPDAAGMNADTLARIDAVLRGAIAGGVMSAATVAVGRHGRLVKLTGYGSTDGRPVDPEAMLFDIASLTKVVGTTAAVMALVEDGQVRLDASVRRYVPQFRGGNKGDVTIRHLLTHTSGLPAGEWLYGSADSPAQALEQVLRTPLVARPGERLIYSDFGMILLAEVVRRRSGDPLDRFLARRVFVPLGMESTMFLPPLQLQPYVVPTALRSERAYVLDAVVHDGNAFRLGGEAGHAGLFSTAPDLAAYAQALLNGGAYGTLRLWQPATVRDFTTRKPGPGYRALGWDTPAPRSSAGSWFSSHSYGHTGFTGTSIWVDPLRDLFVVLLTNRTIDRGTAGQIRLVRQRVHDAAARAITDIRPLSPRPGSPAAVEAERQRQRERARPRRPARRPQGRRG